MKAQLTKKQIFGEKMKLRLITKKMKSFERCYLPQQRFNDLFSSRRQPASVRVNERFLIFSPLAPTIAPFRVLEMQEFFITKTDLLASAASIILQSVKYQLIFVQNISFTEKIKNMFFLWLLNYLMIRFR